MNKEIKNIIFYKKSTYPFDELATIIYSDGTIDKTVYKEAAKKETVKLCTAYARKNNMSIDDIRNADFSKIMNKVGIKYNLNEKEYETVFSNLTGKSIADFEESKVTKPVVQKVEPIVKEPKKVGFFARLSKKIKEKHPKLTRFALGATAALALVAGGYAFGKNSTKAADDARNLNAVTTVYAKDNEEVDYSNLDYSKMTYDELLEVTQNTTKKETMTIVGKFLDYNNIDFANYYAKDGVKDKFCLSFDEVMALHLRVNDFTDEELQSIFDTYDFDSETFNDAYKTGNLQLIGELIAERSDMPLDLTSLFNSDEGKALYEKYNKNMLDLNAAIDKKDTVAIEKIDKEFYNMIIADFPQLSEVSSMEGTVHNYRSSNIENYKTIADIFVAAHRIQARNYNTDLWTDEFIANFNENGAICNHVKDTFDDVEDTLESYRAVIAASKNCANYKESTDPTYEQFKAAKIKELMSKNAYDLDNREWLNFVTINDNLDLTVGYDTGEYVVTTSTSEYTETWSSTTSETTYKTESESHYGSREEAVKAVGEEEVKRQEEAIKEKDEAWNSEQKQQAQEEADKKKQELQDAENAKKEEIDKEVEEENKKTDEDIKDIEEGNKVTNPNIDIDDEYTDKDGNITGIEDVTTDPTGAVTNDKLPNPEETGAEFDKNEPAENVTQPSEPVVEPTQPSEPVVEPTQPSAPVEDTSSNLPDPNETGADFDNNEPAYTPEEQAENIVNDMANNPEAYQTEENAVVYTY